VSVTLQTDQSTLQVDRSRRTLTSRGGPAPTREWRRRLMWSRSRWRRWSNWSRRRWRWAVTIQHWRPDRLLHQPQSRPHTISTVPP